MNVVLVLSSLLAGLQSTAATQEETDPLLSVMEEELQYSLENLAAPDGTRPYYLSYTITDRETLVLSAHHGALTTDAAETGRILDVDLRVGGYELDNTHQIRGAGGSYSPAGARRIPLENDRAALQHEIWAGTDEAFKDATQRYQRVLTNLKTKVEEEQKAADFSREEPVAAREPDQRLELDAEEWRGVLRRLSALARAEPLLHDCSVTLTASAENRRLLSSEGTRLKTGRKLLRVYLTAETRAEDGMNLDQTYVFNAAHEGGLPGEEALAAKFREVMDQVLALRRAPLVEPYSGPAILLNRAAGVFFHEIFGHRIEGHRQKDVEEGQTFARKVGERILPEFLSVHDDPTLATFAGEDLRGAYSFDDEGVPAENVALVEDGVLRTFLLSRSPLEDFPRSNGHGRREPGQAVVARQGNLLVSSRQTVPAAELRALLVAECQAQGKPYGLLFEDITGGFTTTQRSGPQAFKVLPVVVYRIFADGRPDELVRGADIVGTPLACFSEILVTGDDPQVFNGTCGAESGMVPVSAIAPSLLVRKIEIEKRRREQDRPPILPAPLAELAAPDDSAAER